MGASAGGSVALLVYLTVSGVFFLYNGILVPVRTSFGLRRRSGKT